VEAIVFADSPLACIGRANAVLESSRALGRPLTARAQHDSTLTKIADGRHDLGGVAAQVTILIDDHDIRVLDHDTGTLIRKLVGLTVVGPATT